MNHIKRVKPIVVDDKTTFSIDDFIMYFVNLCDVFNKNSSGIRTSIRIENAVKDSKDDEFIPLESNDYALLRDVINSPPGDVTYPLRPARVLMPFIDAVMDAVDSTKKSQEEK